jgi:hypothetical protein
MHQLVYASRPFGFDAAVLSGILVHARKHNAAHDMTGALICRNDLYLQLLEGPKDAIDTLYEKIKADDRHVHVQQLVYRPITIRMFPEWAMRDDPVQSWMWSRDQVAAGDVERASEADALSAFIRLANRRPTVVRSHPDRISSD